MKIVTRTKIIALLSVILVAVFGASLIYSFNQDNKAAIEESMSDQINEKIMGLNILTHDYLLYRSERAMKQWWSVYDEIGRLSAPAVFSTQEQLDIMDKIIKKHAHLSDIFSSLLIQNEKVSKGEVGEELKKRLVSQFLMEAQSLIILSLKLRDFTTQNARKINNLAKLIRALLFIALFVILSVNSFWLMRRLVAPLIRLHKGTEIIGSGNLDYKIGTDAKDEIGQLSRAFDNMTENLKQITVSRDDLSKEIERRKEVEARLLTATAELERSNNDLEQFAYVASHDLQEPLRMVSNYTQLLAQHYEGRLDEKAKKFMDYSVDGAIRMQRLINDLLSYSRVGTRGKPLEAADTHALLGEALGNLAVVIEENRAVITNDDLPVVRVDASQLVQMFQNLIANAIKFHGENIPHIHVSARENEREWVFSIRDNGIGIERHYADRIFVIFQRLHTREEYPGTGIGLAVCKRIAERHGGRIWFESEPGKGSTFFFSIMK